jgi:hypothetical protein
MTSLPEPEAAVLTKPSKHGDFVFQQTTIGLDRWPGEHRPGAVIHTSSGGGFVFDHLDTDAQGGLVAVYVWRPTS